MVPELRERKRELLQTLVEGSPEVDANDPSTWPPYVRRIEATTREHFGNEAARRQVAAEIAFLNGNLLDEGWTLLTDRDNHNDSQDGERDEHDESF